MNKLFNRFLVILGVLFLFTTLLVSCYSEYDSEPANEYVEFFIGDTVIDKKKIINNSVELPSEDLVNKNLPLDYILDDWFSDNQWVTPFIYNNVGEVRQVFAGLTSLEVEYENNLLSLDVIVNGEKIITLEAHHGTLLIDILAPIIDPERSGYVFAGWSLDGVKEITTQTMSEEITSVFPLWNEIIINGDALHLFNNLIDDVLISRYMNEEDIAILIDGLINETRDSLHFSVNVSFIYNNDISINIDRILINLNSFYGDTQEEIPSGFVLPNIYLDMTYDEILEEIQGALGTYFINFTIEILYYHTLELEIVIIYNRITGNMIFGDVVTTGRIPSSLVNEMRIFADFDKIDIENEVRRVLDIYAERTSRLNLRGINFKIGVFDEGTRAITITLSRIPITGIIPTGTAIPRLVDLNIGTLYQDMADYEINEQIALAMESLNQSNLVFDNFNILLGNVNTTDLLIEINRISITHQFSGNASDAVTGLLINNLFKDLSDSEIIYLVNQSIDNSQALWFNHDALSLAVIDININFVNLQFTHITRNISLTGDAILELNLSNEDFDLNMTMDNDAIRHRIIYIIEQSGGNLSHLEEILPEYTLIVNVDINFRRALIYIDLNTTNIYYAVIYGANQTVTQDVYILDVRYGLELSEALVVLNISSESHLNHQFIYEEQIIETDTIHISVDWGRIRTFEVSVIFWTESQLISEQFAIFGAEETIFNIDFGTTPYEFSEYIISQTDIVAHMDSIEFAMFVLDEVSLDDNDLDERFQIRMAENDTPLRNDVRGYLMIDFKLHYLNVYIPNLMGGYAADFNVLVRVNNNVYDKLIIYQELFNYLVPGVAIDGWDLFIVGTGERIEVVYGLLMIDEDLIAVAVFRPLTQNNVTIILEADENEEIHVNGNLVQDGEFTFQVLENAILIHALRDLIITRTGYYLIDFFLEGSIIPLDNTFRLGLNDDLTITVSWEIFIRHIVIDYMLPTLGNGNVSNELIVIEVAFGTPLETAMGDMWILPHFSNTHLFVGWIFYTTNGQRIFDGTTMPEFDLFAEAQWTPREFLVTIDANGGTINEEAVLHVSIPFGDFITDHLDGVVTYRYAFIFSHFENAITSEIINSETTMPAINVVLMVIWEEVIYEITFNLEGGVLNGYVEQFTYMITLVVFMNNFVITMAYEPFKMGYDFIGWLYNGELVDIYTYFLYSRITLFALWEQMDIEPINLTIHAASAIFNGSNTIIFEDIYANNYNIRTLLEAFKWAYLAVGTQASTFNGVVLNYVNGINLIGFSLTNGGENILFGEFPSNIQYFTFYAVLLHYTVGLNFVQNGEGQIVSGFGSVSTSITTIVIPYYFAGQPVVEVRNMANRSGLVEVVFPRFLQVIAEGTFRNNSTLRNVILSDLPYLRHIGVDAFRNSGTQAGLLNLTLQNLPSLEVIDNGAFYNLNATNFTFEGLTSLRIIGNDAFRTLTVNAGINLVINSPILESIGSSAFLNVRVISLVIENSSVFTTIGTDAFRNTQMQYLTLRNLPSIQSIQAGAFQANSVLRNITLDNINLDMTIPSGTATMGGNVSGRTVHLLGNWYRQPAWWQNSGQNPFGNFNNGNTVFRNDAGQVIFW